MGDVGNFFLGGSKNKQNATNSSHSESTSDNSSVSDQNSANISQQLSSAGNLSTNRAYDPLSAALTSNLGNVSSASNMMGALLGLPESTFNYATPAAPTSAPMPSHATVSLPGLIEKLGAVQPEPATPPVTPPPPPPPPPPPGQTPPPPSGSSHKPGFGLGGASRPDGIVAGILGNYRENGGPVAAGQPYIVGEKRPEVFVPHTSGTIVPSVPQAAGFGLASPATAPSQYSGSNPYNPSPGNANTALNNFSNSSGMNFILDQGQKAISGASGANGTFNSGATGKALETFGQNIGKSYLQTYMDNLQKYANLGLGSASALSGAGGTNIGQSQQSSGAVGTSTGHSQSVGSSDAFSDSSGISSGSGNSKKGLIPDILG